jgi:hypothetical protein
MHFETRLWQFTGSVSKVEMATPMALIYKVLFPSISTFETPPSVFDPLARDPWRTRPLGVLVHGLPVIHYPVHIAGRLVNEPRRRQRAEHSCRE